MKMARRPRIRSLNLLVLMAVSLVAAAPTWAAPLDPETKTNVANALWMQNYNPALIPPAILAKLLSPANSDAAFGSRLDAHLLGLIDNPMTFTPDYTAYYLHLDGLTTSITPHQAHGRNDYLGLDQSRGFLDLPFLALPNTLEFPHANGFDLTSQYGWYYVVGTAIGANGKHYGILLMMLASPLLPNPVATQMGLTPTQNEVMQLQLAVNEEGGAHYQARPTVVAGTTGLLEFKPDLFYTVMGKNRMESLRQDGTFFPMRIQAKGWDHSTTPPTPIKIDITFSSGATYLREGNNGCQPCCARIGTLYYSIPRMVLDPGKSTLVLNGRNIKLNGGNFWLDHQWGTSGNPKVDVIRAALNTQPPRVGGWDFFAINFTGNRQLTVSALHTKEFEAFYNQTGKKPGTMTVKLHGKYIDEHDHFTQVGGELSVTDWIRSTSTPDPAQFPVSNTWYPDKWELSFGTTLPADIRKFSLKPLTNGDSTLYFTNGGQYQEAPVEVINSQGNQVGFAFAEATGYSDFVPVVVAAQFKIAGLPNTPAVFTPPTPSPALVAESKLFLEKPANQIGLLIESELCSYNNDGQPVEDELLFNGRWQ